jgi:hypothetical protein
MEREIGRLVVGSVGGTPTEAVSSFAILLRQAFRLRRAYGRQDGGQVATEDRGTTALVKKMASKRRS